MEAKRRERFMQHAMAAHGNAVFLVALSQTRSEHDARDVSQDVFLTLLTDETEFASDEHLRAWLLRATINRCRELYRTPWRRRVESADELARELPSTDAETEDAALAELRSDPVWQALQALPDKLREVALLHYVEQYTGEEVARIVGCAPATVRTRLHRARKQMRQMLNPVSEESRAEGGHHGQEAAR